jgi:eukaryotic-like serine/threonine-protein kinase
MNPNLTASLGYDRFLLEIRLTAQLDHPHLVPVHDSGEAAGQLWYTMPFVNGESLRERLRRETQLSADTALEIGRQIASAVDYANRRGVLHRDLKPENILLADDQVRVVDFGVAKALEGETGRRLTSTGLAVGTPAYMAPEQVSGGAVNARTDIYALGCVLYEMLAGEPPFTGPTSQSVIAKRFLEPAPSIRAVRPELQEGLDAALRKALAFEPDDRFGTATELLAALASSPKKEDVAPTITVSRRAAHSRRWPVPVIVVNVIAVLAAVGGFLLFRGRTHDPEAMASAPKMIAVLPFKNLGHPTNEYFADGLSEEITSRLTSISGLGVISRTSSHQYRDTKKPLSQVGRELGVNYILEGSVHWDSSPESGSRIRVTPQLVQVSDDRHLWSERYDAKLADVFAVQSDIAAQVTQALGVALGASESREIEVQPTASPEAYDYYLRGQAHYSRFGEQPRQSLEAAIDMYTRAVQLDPRFADAYARLGEAHTRMVWSGVDGSQARLAHAKAAIGTALRLQPDLPEAHLALGRFYLWTTSNYPQAHAAFARARVRRPNDGALFESLADLARHQGQWDSAAAHYHRAVELDPRSPDLGLEAAATLFLMRAYSGAERYALRVQALDPQGFSPYLLLAGIAVNRDADTAHAQQILAEGLARVGLEQAPKISPDMLYLLKPDDSTRAALERLPFKAFRGDTGYCFVWRAEFARLHGFTARAQAYSDSARVALQRAIRTNPRDPYWDSVRHQLLGSAYLSLGRTAEAIRAAQYAVQVYPVSEVAHEGTEAMIQLARIYAAAGDHDAALDQLDRLLVIPSQISRRSLAVDPHWQPLRKNPRFERLLMKDISRRATSPASPVARE